MLKQSPTRLDRQVKRFAVQYRNLPLFVLCAGISMCIEVFAAAGRFQENTAQVSILGAHIALAPVEALISLGMGLLALYANMAASAMKADPRPQERERAFVARILAVLLLSAPIIYGGEEFALNSQTRDWSEYVGSPQYQADLEQASDHSLDSQVRADAAANLERATKPEHARLDGHLVAGILWAAFLYSSNVIAAGSLWRAKPETEAERARREAAVEAEALRKRRQLAVEKARKTREANAKAKRRGERLKSPPVANVLKLVGGKE